MKPVYIKAYIYGRPISRALIDGGAIMNVMLIGILKKLGKSKKDLQEMIMKMTNFIGESTDALRFYISELTVGTKLSTTMFFGIGFQARILFAFRERLDSFQYVYSIYLTSAADVFE